MTGREEWLQRLLVGDLNPDSDEARRFFDEHPDVRGELESMRRLEDAIRGVGRERGEVVETALDSDESDMDAERFVAERLAGAPSSVPPRPLGLLRWAVPLAAAAALLLFLWGPWSGPAGPRDDGPGPDPGPMMGSDLTLLPPLSGTHRVDELRWEYELEGAQYFEVSVYDPDDPFDAIDSHETEDNAWRPDPADADRWPDPFEWRVAVKQDRTVVAEASALVQRSP